MTLGLGWVISLSVVGTLLVMVIVLALAEWAGKRIVKAEVKALKDKIEEERKEAQAERGAVERLRNEVVAALSEIRVAAATITGALGTIGSFEVERRALKGRLDALESVVDTHEVFIGKLQQERMLAAEMLGATGRLPPGGEPPEVEPVTAELDAKRPPG